jgi:N-methylhydantoinase A
VTDANVVLGRLNPSFLLGGTLEIDASLAHRAIEEHVARPRKISVVEAAAAMIAIADANMAHAVRFVSVERGLDPADFTLVAFGGAGPVHAASVARELGVAGVLVPPAPGVLCAMGVLVKDLQMDFSRTRIVTEASAECCASVDALYLELEARARTAFSAEAGAEGLALARAADVRYVGQNHELTVDVPAGTIDDAALATVKERLHAAHREMFGYASEDKLFQLVTLRVRARVPVARHEFSGDDHARREGRATASHVRLVYFEESNGYAECPVYERDSLRPGDAFKGPAIVEQMDATTVIPPDFSARVDEFSNLLLTVI